ncbi:uncharacterized protein N7459_006270 [Penicillium hispanicum]|uniref:uncharacterized protein n=1 Tax=Penicillium hispanicum TaxID=1080232 RepID=UPI00253FA5FF|nr:uncharacterized protein N7459_006270 [Penicillium hispanicum]KAJ5580285.1 hypothetical protein N7459_006270 [Penicillium hispanicum]
MPPCYGALGATFQLARIFQGCSLIAIIGMVAKFISVIVSNDATPPNILIGTISVTCIAVIYCIITAILYFDDILPFLPCAALDLLVLVGMIVVAVVMGKPLSYLKCSTLASLGDADATVYAFSSKLDSVLASISKKIDYGSWIGASKTICLETKAIWGLSIALCILFFFSCICSVCLWRQKANTASEENNQHPPLFPTATQETPPRIAKSCIARTNLSQPARAPHLMNPFIRRSQADAAWHPVGLTSALPELDADKDAYRIAPRCKAFAIPKTATSAGAPAEVDIDLPGDLKDQVLVFKYKGKVHAIDHQCPHSSFPLSQGNVFDIEDFGITLSAGITCPKHGWSFDLFSGQADRGNYKLKMWEVQLRDPATATVTGDGLNGVRPEQEVWVRRKQRIG